MSTRPAASTDAVATYGGRCVERDHRCVRLEDATRMWRLRPLLRPDVPGHVLLQNSAERWDDASAPYEAGPTFSFVVPDANFRYLARTDYAGAALNGGVVVDQSHVDSKYFRVPAGSRRVRVRGVDGFVTEFGRGGELRKLVWYVPVDDRRGRLHSALDGVRHRSLEDLVVFLDGLPEV